VAKITGKMLRLDAGSLALSRHEHAYHAPYDRDRMGELLEARRESYIEATVWGDRCRIVTLFCVQPADAPAVQWRHAGDRWSIGEIGFRLNATAAELGSAQTQISLDHP
jgi:hypothetical protein